MDSTVATVYWIVFIVTAVAIQAGLWGVFVKAGQPGWKSLIPVYNYWICIHIVEKPKWWLILIVVPVVNLVMPIVLIIEFCKYFGRPGLGWQTLGMLVPFVILPYFGFSPKVKFGKLKQVKKKTRAMEWAEAIVFALIAATFIRTFFIEAYKIPTPSMEGSLLVGDHLFVSKFHYGARFPLTPIAFPLAHHTMPLLGTKAYVEWIKLPYFRFPGLQTIHRNDVVVFNFPEGDTVVISNQAPSYYDLKRRGGRYTMDQLTVRPLDKKENYVKRCVAIPGDVLEVRNGQLFINGEPGWNPPGMQFLYTLRASQPLPQEFFMSRGITDVGPPNSPHSGVFEYPIHTSPEKAEQLRQLPVIRSVDITFSDTGSVFFSIYHTEWREYSQLFPNTKTFQFTPNNFGPINIPKKGTTVTLDRMSLPFYKRVIAIYEGSKLEELDGRIIINGVETNEYTFKLDYYFMMGDNRHNSQDSRFWGFVPETHIVGKPWFIWFSWDKNAKGIINKIRWNRLFSSVK